MDTEPHQVNPATTTVSSINRAVADPVCSAATVSWTVTFGAAVTGLSASNFTLANTGLTSPMITNVSGSGTTWTVTASTGSGSGMLGLNMTNSTGVTPMVSELPFMGRFIRSTRHRHGGGWAGSNALYDNDLGDAGGEYAQRRHGRVDSRDGAIHVGNAVQQHDFADSDVYPSGRRRRLYLALDDQQQRAVY